MNLRWDSVFMIQGKVIWISKSGRDARSMGFVESKCLGRGKINDGSIFYFLFSFVHLHMNCLIAEIESETT